MSTKTASTFPIENATRHLTIDQGRWYYDYRFGRARGIGAFGDPTPRGDVFVGSTIAGGRGNPTISARDGAVELTLDRAAERQLACLSFDDHLNIPIEQLLSVDVWLRGINWTADEVMITFGLAAARPPDDRPTSMEAYLLWQLVGANGFKVLSAAGTPESIMPATDARVQAAPTTRRFQFDFGGGANLVAPQTGYMAADGSLSNVVLSVENPAGNLVRVLPDVNVDVSDYVAGGFQLFAQIEKTGDCLGVSASLAFERMLVGIRAPSDVPPAPSIWPSIY